MSVVRMYAHVFASSILLSVVSVLIEAAILYPLLRATRGRRVARVLVNIAGVLALPTVSLLYCVVELQMSHGWHTAGEDIFLVWLVALPIQLLASVVALLLARAVVHRTAGKETGLERC